MHYSLQEMVHSLNLLPEAFTGNFISRLLMACLLGGAIGFERDIHGRAAGLRTNMLVSLGAALFMLVSVAMAKIYSGGWEVSGLRVDPSRIAAQIVTGIGFLGAGAIIKEGFNVRGLTTAACLWVSAGVGMAAGAGLFEMAILVTLIGLFTLVVVNRFEKAYAKDSYRVLKIRVSNNANISTIRLFHKGVTDKLSHGIVHDLENSGHAIHQLHWGH